MKLIIVINGSGGVGKDTLVAAAATKWRVRNVSAVTKIKEIAHHYLCWNGEKDLKSRKMLADLMNVMDEYNDFTTSYLMQETMWFYNSSDEILFLHMREGAKIEKYKTRYNEIFTGNQQRVLTLLVTRKAMSGTVYGNAADDGVYQYEYDYVYANDCPLDSVPADFCLFLEQLMCNELYH